MSTVSKPLPKFLKQGRADRSARLVHSQEVAGSNPAPATNPLGDTGFYEPDSVTDTRGGGAGCCPPSPSDKAHLSAKEIVWLCAAIVIAVFQLVSYHSDPVTAEASEYEVSR